MTDAKFSFRRAVLVLAWVPLVLAGYACSISHTAPTEPETAAVPASAPSQATFATPDKAVEALVDAMRTGDMGEIDTILGPGSDQVVSSGDDVADQQRRQKFLAEYDAKHELIVGADGSLSLTVGDDDWPMPIPIVSDGGRWRFDTSAGLNEILNRRIGKNELAAIQVCLAVADAQNDYAEQMPEGGDLPVYAQKFFSDPGEKNGLYWPTNPGQPESPLGPLVAEAADQGYSRSESHETPYHGYYYRILTSQGPNAQGSASNYIVNGKMIGGFALVAYPAQYGNSGVMTFIENYQGVVYQKDLGPETATLAHEMSSFDPDTSWKVVERMK
jgi:hypothetical protein